jgi:hypothetical protein
VASQNAYEMHTVRFGTATESMSTHLPLGREVSVTSGNTKDEGIVLCELVGGDGRDIGLRGSVHLRENLARERLGNPEDDEGQTR